MKKQLAIIGLIILLVCVGLSGCNQSDFKSDRDKLVGRWFFASENYTLTFFDNGTFIANVSGNFVYLGTWEINSGKSLSLTYLDSPLPLTRSYSFSNNDNTLTIYISETGKNQVFIRIK